MHKLVNKYSNTKNYITHSSLQKWHYSFIW